MNNTRPPHIEATIKNLAERARKELEGTMLFGEAIDPDNFEDVLACFEVKRYMLEEARKSLSSAYELQNIIFKHYG